jgi:hypothetical protein
LELPLVPKVKICFIDSAIDHFSEEYRFIMRTDSSGWEDVSQRDYIQMIEKKDLLVKILKSEGLIGQGTEVVILAQDVVKPSWSLNQINKILANYSKAEARLKKGTRWKKKIAKQGASED